MTDEELQAIEARERAATDGPWEYLGGVVMNAVQAVNEGYEGLIEPADGNFIAHARQDIPALIAEVKRLSRVIDRARDNSDDVRLAIDAAVQEVSIGASDETP